MAASLKEMIEQTRQAMIENILANGMTDVQTLKIKPKTGFIDFSSTAYCI
ncbi:aspartyl-phosphate phosphatase Spo0E family protein [Cytobacillus sp. NCCP-133]|nr:aspartyl-phosphate phosphatase Spo0E family protein [Cytobacillus sp. NCCP-133]GLB60074.1 hypothetical protein NCCP133_22060 [Cytobacillus sp. NCCP-133]